MPRPVTCPACREELDIPDALRGRPVRCAACQTTFTPPVDDAPPAGRREPRDDPREDPGDDPRERRGRPDRPNRRPAPRRSLLWLWLTGFGMMGLCCLGCGGAMVVFVGLADPKLPVAHNAADGRFQANFPGPVTVASKPTTLPDGKMSTTTTVEHQRTVLGNPYDRYFVHSTDLKKPLTGVRADKAAKAAADDLAAQPGGKLRRSGPARTDGADGYEVEVDLGGDKEATVARVFVVGDRLYVVGITGHNMQREQQMRIHDFWDSFKLTDAKADKPKPAPKEPDQPDDE